MLNDHYNIEISKDFKTYEFISVGLKGSITKVIRYSEINVKGFYNLGFGDKEARTRLYRMGITNNLEEIEKDFIIMGLTETHWEVFRKNITYGAFLIRCKNVDLQL